MPKVSASFVLRSCDLAIASIGSINATRSVLTWSNVDIRTIIGDELWDKHQYFSLTLVSFLTTGWDKPPFTTIAGPTYTHENTSAIVYLQGLQFVNCGYSSITKNNTAIAPIGVFTYPYNGQGTLVQNNTNCNIIFRKGGSVVDLSISLIRITDGVSLTYGGSTGNDLANALSPQCYWFKIEGVEKY